jgi:hypothetical protein
MALRFLPTPTTVTISDGTFVTEPRPRPSMRELEKKSSGRLGSPGTQGVFVRYARYFKHVPAFVELLNHVSRRELPQFRGGHSSHFASKLHDRDLPAVQYSGRLVRRTQRRNPNCPRCGRPERAISGLVQANRRPSACLTDTCSRRGTKAFALRLAGPSWSRRRWAAGR